MSMTRQHEDDNGTVPQEGVRSATPAMIPGAFEVRTRRSAALASAGPPRVAPRVPRAAGRRTVFERIWRYVMRPTDTPPF
jgi:hypothetical protein